MQVEFHSGTTSSRFHTEYLHSFTWYWIEFHSCIISSRFLTEYTEYLYLFIRYQLKFHSRTSIHIPDVAPDWNFHSGTKSGRTFHKYHAKEVRVYSGMKFSTCIGLADQLTRFFDLLIFLPHFHSQMRNSIQGKRVKINYVRRYWIETHSGIM